MRVNKFLILFACMVLIAPCAKANDENLPDSLIIDNIEVLKGGQLAVKIEFVNDEELAALTIPLAVNGKGILVDSISFVGSRVEYLKMLPVTVAEDRHRVVFGAIVMIEDYIPVGRGLMATLFLSADSTKNAECVIDTTTIGPATVLFTKTSSASFIPNFSAGSVKIVEALPKEEEKK